MRFTGYRFINSHRLAVQSPPHRVSTCLTVLNHLLIISYFSHFMYREHATWHIQWRKDTASRTPPPYSCFDGCLVSNVASHWYDAPHLDPDTDMSLVSTTRQLDHIPSDHTISPYVHHPRYHFKTCGLLTHDFEKTTRSG